MWLLHIGDVQPASGNRSRLQRLSSFGGDVYLNMLWLFLFLWVGWLKTTLHKRNNNSSRYLCVFSRSTSRVFIRKSKGKFTFCYLPILVFTAVCQLVKWSENVRIKFFVLSSIFTGQKWTALAVLARGLCSSPYSTPHITGVSLFSVLYLVYICNGYSSSACPSPLISRRWPACCLCPEQF
jgi:hypothetical protein